MATLESKITERLAGFEQSKKVLEAALSTATDPTIIRKKIRDIQMSEAEYLLEIIPYIREHERVEEPRREFAKSSAGILGFVKVDGKSNRGKLLTEYRLKVEKDVEVDYHVEREDDMTCLQCDVGYVIVQDESALVCPCCGMSKYFMEGSSANMTYEQEVNQEIINTYAYKRINHFSEWLSSVQGKENTDIPDDVVQALRAEFKKVRTTKATQIKPTKVREFLKKLKLTKYYEHVHHITNLLNGIPNTRFPPALEHRLRTMFQEIQAPWERTKPKNRSNFFSYSYVLYKCCELLGEDQYLHLFPLLKSTEKLYQQDQMWKNVCKELGWEFRSSV